MDELWQQFCRSGSVEDYLKYKQQQEPEGSYADDSQRLDHQRTDYRRE